MIHCHLNCECVRFKMVQIVTDMTSNSEQKNTTTTMSPKQKFDFNYVHPRATSLSVASLGVENASLSLISSPNLTGSFRPQISSAMPAIAGLIFLLISIFQNISFAEYYVPGSERIHNS